MKKSLHISAYSIFALLSIVLFNTGCSKNSDSDGFSALPYISTLNVVANVTSTTALSGGDVTFVNLTALTANGICWSATNQTPTTADSKVTDPTIENDFTLAMTGLSPNTTYYVRAFATNSAGTGYGTVVKFTTTGVATTPTGTASTFAGSLSSGNANGTGTAASFNMPQSIAADAQGNLYVADAFNNVIRKITPGGVVTTFAGTGTLGYVDGPGTTAQFYSPEGITVDGSGNVYVADLGNNLIRKITPGGAVSTLAGNGYSGYADGNGTKAVFKNPHGLAVDGSGNVYVADQGNNVIRKITSAGVVTTVAGYTLGGYIDSVSTTAAFRAPAAVAVDAAGTNLYVSDRSNHAIRKIVLATGIVTTIAGNFAQTAFLNFPNGITIDANSNIFFIDEGGRVMELTAARVLYTLLGNPNTAGFVNGIGTSAQFNTPTGLTIYQGVLYVVDSNNNVIRKVTIP